MKTKICKKCGRELPLSMFNRNNSKADGLQSYCKDCDREHGRKKNGSTGRYRRDDEPTRNQGAVERRLLMMMQIKIDYKRNCTRTTDEYQRMFNCCQPTLEEIVKIGEMEYITTDDAAKYVEYTSKRSTLRKLLKREALLKEQLIEVQSKIDELKTTTDD